MRAARLPMAQHISTLPRAIRSVRLPREEDEISDFQPHHAEPASFDPFDPFDQDVFIFDWSERAYAGDPIVSALVVSSPPGVTVIAVGIVGTSVLATIGPFPSAPAVANQPITYGLRCTATFRSSRISNFTVPFEVKTL